MHSIGRGYHKDLQTRAALREVLTKILQQGPKSDTLAKTGLADRFEQLVQLVTMIDDKGEWPIAIGLSNGVTANQRDELARVFVTIVDAKHRLSPLLWNMFYREVEVSACMQTLFRGNSLGSKILTFCFKIYGAKFLQGLLEPLSQERINNMEGVCFEAAQSRSCTEARNKAPEDRREQEASAGNQAQIILLKVGGKKEGEREDHAEQIVQIVKVIRTVQSKYSNQLEKVVRSFQIFHELQGREVELGWEVAMPRDFRETRINAPRNNAPKVKMEQEASAGN